MFEMIYVIISISLMPQGYFILNNRFPLCAMKSSSSRHISRASNLYGMSKFLWHPATLFMRGYQVCLWAYPAWLSDEILHQSFSTLRSHIPLIESFPFVNKFTLLFHNKKRIKKNWLYLIYLPQRPSIWLQRRLMYLIHNAKHVTIVHLVLIKIVLIIIMMDILLKNVTSSMAILLASPTQTNLLNNNNNIVQTTLPPQISIMVLLLSKILVSYFSSFGIPIRLVRSNTRTFSPWHLQVLHDLLLTLQVLSFLLPHPIFGL